MFNGESSTAQNTGPICNKIGMNRSRGTPSPDFETPSDLVSATIYQKAAMPHH